MAEEKYLHGFDEVEQARLYAQATFLEQILFKDLDFSNSQHLLEVGSGVGAQSEIILRRYPSLQLTGIEYNEHQLSTAKHFMKQKTHLDGRYHYLQGDAMDMPFDGTEGFDAAYICWVLEHVPNPLKALSEVRRVLRQGSTIAVTEVLNSSFFLEPYSPNTLKFWMAFNDAQYEMGGDPFIGAKLGNMLLSLGYTNIKTQVKTFHLDNRQPAKRAQMITYWADLLMSAADNLLKEKRVDKSVVKGMRKELKVVAKDPNAVFFYSFIQAQANT